MIDDAPLPQERSAASTRDKGLPEGLAFFASDDDRPMLGDPAVVDTIVRDFLARANLANDGPQVLALAKATAAIMQGGDKQYRADAWHSPAGLGAMLRERHQMDVPNEEAVALYLASQALAVLKVREEYITDVIEADVAEFQLAALAEDTCSALLGLPQVSDE